MVKVLLGAAAFVVVAYVGYFFWGEWDRARTRGAVEQASDRCWELVQKRNLGDTSDELTRDLEYCYAMGVARRPQ